MSPTGEPGPVPLLLDLSSRNRDHLAELSPHRHLFHSILVDRGGVESYVLFSVADSASAGPGASGLEPVDVQGFSGSDVAAFASALDDPSENPLDRAIGDSSLGFASDGRPVFVQTISRGDDPVGFLVSHSADGPAVDRSVTELVGHLLVTRRELSSLLRSYDFVRSILHDVSAGLIAIDTLGRVIYLNASAEHILGTSAREAIGADALRVFRTMIDGDNVLLDGLQGNSNFIDIRVRRGDGKEIRVDLRLSQIRSRNGSILGATAIFSDVSELHTMRDQIRHRDRLATIGELAAGIAHEIGNPLTGIKGCAQLLRDRLEPDNDLHRMVDVIFEEVDRLARLSGQVRHFGRPGDPRMKQSNVAEIIERVLQIVRPEADEAGVAIHGHPGVLPVVYLDPDQIEQVFLNLAKNAIDAMRGKGGRLEVQTASVSRPIRTGRRTGRRSRDPLSEQPRTIEREFVRVVFRDTGPGIAKKDQERIFDPFFTTKANGIGLGLSISHTIVREHSGFFSVESEPGKGTAFTVDLPVDRRAG